MFYRCKSAMSHRSQYPAEISNNKTICDCDLNSNSWTLSAAEVTRCEWRTFNSSLTENFGDPWTVKNVPSQWGPKIEVEIRPTNSDSDLATMNSSFPSKCVDRKYLNLHVMLKSWSMIYSPFTLQHTNIRWMSHRHKVIATLRVRVIITKTRAQNNIARK